MERQRYPLFDRLSPEEYAPLEADIVKRGVMVPVEVDDKGNILDGHHRAEIAEKHGKQFKKIVRRRVKDQTIGQGGLHERRFRRG